MSATGAAAPMPTASSPETLSMEQLLEQLLVGEGGDRIRALLQAINQGLAEVAVADYCCGSLNDPLVLTFRQLCKHVFREDHPIKVSARGYRAHTPVNVVHWHEDLGGHGPGLKVGAP